MRTANHFLLGAVVLLLPIIAFAQNGTITGKIIDAKFAEGLIGCSVKLDDQMGGAITDLDGNYTLRNVVPGKHKITINYTGYQAKTVEDIEVKAGETTNADVLMEESSGTVISEVVIVAKAQRESMSALTILQKNSPVIADGISAETIRRTPDRTTGDVIRRVSGASIQDGGFAVIRGLTDRYNMAMLNGTMLPSTEPDRKAFSFDLFPSSFIDNLLVMKTASADLPGEFAGGAILLNTRDIPESNYLRFSMSGGYNTITTFKPHWQTQQGSTDWLGIDDGGRALPAGFASDKAAYLAMPKADRIEMSKLFENDWAINRDNSARPNGSFQLATGLTTAEGKKIKAGTTLALSYNNSNRLTNAQRADFDLDGKLFEFNDETFQNNVLWGALWNSAVQIGSHNKITLTTIYTTNTSNTSIYRTGQRLKDNNGDVLSLSNEFIQNQLLNARLGGEHSFGDRGIKLTWSGGFNQTTRDVPSLRRIEYNRPTALPGEEPEPFRAFLPFGSGSLDYGGRFYSNLNENTENANVDLTFPFAVAGTKQSVKVGFMGLQKDRTFDARVLGAIQSVVAGFDSRIPEQGINDIFATENFKAKGILMDEITNPSDNYDAQSSLGGAFLMFNNNIGDRIRLSWGGRYESFRQQLQSIDYTNAPVDIDRTTNNFLPSANLTFVLNERHQFRASASKTVTRPEFREIAPFSFYDFNLNAGILGTPGLLPGSIINMDLRYEFYPGQNQLMSVSAFYKDFTNPIEFSFFSSGAGTRTFAFQNIPGARNYGIEAEIRKNFDFLGTGGENWVMFTNAALIGSDLDLTGIGYFDENRPLQGQSPYVFNAGLSYNAPFGMSSTIVYNVIGDRINQVGLGDPVTGEGYGDIYERHRNLLDFSVSQRIAGKGELKLTCSDLLRPDFIFYQDNNRNQQFDENEDNVMQRIEVGTTVSLSFGWKF
jgi:TonB-dependent receptor